MKAGHKLSSEIPLNDLSVAMLVLAGAIVLESLSLAGALREANLMRGERSLRLLVETYP